MGADPYDYDVIIIGSGFGGSVSALRLTEKGYRVAVLEAGRRFDDQDFADTSWDLKGYLFRPEVGCYGIQRIDMLKDCLILSGAGVGGGSLVYANTLYEPLDPFYTDPSWSDDHRLEARAGAVLRAGQADARRRGVPALHPGRRGDEADRREARRRRHLPPDTGRRLLRWPRAAARGGRARPVLRGCRARPQPVPQLRRVHDRLPAQRQEHPGQELPAPGRVAGRGGAPDDHGDPGAARR